MKRHITRLATGNGHNKQRILKSVPGAKDNPVDVMRTCICSSCRGFFKYRPIRKPGVVACSHCKADNHIAADPNAPIATDEELTQFSDSVAMATGDNLPCGVHFIMMLVRENDPKSGQKAGTTIRTDMEMKVAREVLRDWINATREG